MQEKQLQRPFKTTETHWNSSYQNIFKCIPIILGRFNYFNYFFLESNAVSRYVGLIDFLSKLCLYYIQDLFEFVELPLHQQQLFCSLLIELLLLPFCNIWCDTFFDQPAFALFYRYYHCLEDKLIWPGPFEQTNFSFITKQSSKVLHSYCNRFSSS